MFGNIFNSTTIPVLEQVVNFAQARHTVLAGNIANMDTPGYKTRDLSVEDFQARLKKAIEISHHPKRTPAPGEPVPRREAARAQGSKTPTSILRHDENDVGVEQQVTEMVKNQIRHNMALAIMTNQFRLLQTAISGRV